MTNIAESIKEKRWIHYLIIATIGLLVAIPFFWVQLRETDDGYVHILRVLSMGLSFEEGVFPFLLTPFFCRNFGYTMTVFYGPMVTYLPYLLSLIGNSAHVGIKIFSALTIPISGIFMYNFMHEVTKNKGISFLSAILYMVFPYRLEVYFDRFAMGEFTAFVFIPLVFQGLYNLLHGDKQKHFYITIGAVGLILSHTISTVFTALFCVIYILFHIKDFLQKEVLIKCMINIIFIILISAFFLIPMLEFEEQAHYTIFDSDRMRTSGEWVSKNTIEPIQFLKDIEEDGVSFVIGIPSLIMLTISILSYQYIDKKHKDFYIVSLILGFVTLYMCTRFFPWKIMPQFLTSIQYAWRLEGFAFFFLVPVMAMNVWYLLQNIKNEKWKDIVYLLVVSMILAFTVLELSVYKVVKPNIDMQYEETIKSNPVISHFSVNRDYLPYKASLKQRDYMLTREDKVYPLKGNVVIENQEKYAFDLKFTIKQAEKGVVLELPYLFYPGYTAELSYQGKNKKLLVTESENGFAQVVLPEMVEEGEVKVSYTGTLLEKWSYAISFVAVIIFIEYILHLQKQKNMIRVTSKKKHKNGEKNEK